MGNLAVTAAQVQEGSGSTVSPGYMGEDGEAGESVYLNAGSGKWMLEDADGDTSASQMGILQNTAALGQPCDVCVEGEIDLGVDAGVVAGVVYVVSPTAGKVCADGDGLMVSGKYKKVLGIGAAANILRLHPHNSDISLP